MRRDSPRYGNFPKRQKSRERPWNRASPAFGKLWEHAGKCRVDLRKIELTQFEQHMRNLTAIWFGGEKETEFYAQLREFIQNSGIYGTPENLGVQRAVRAGRKGWKGKMQMWLNVIFLPYKEMKMQYPYLLNCPVLLPIAWIQRFFRTIFLRRKKAKRILSSMNAERDVVKAHQELFEKLGF